MSISPIVPSGIQSSFTAASGGNRQRAKSKTAAPFSLRLTDEEHACLKAQAGGQSLGRYIRSELLGKRTTAQRLARRPSLDNTKVAKALAGLGQSRIAANLNQIAKAANIGVIDVSPALINDLEEACLHIRELRDELISALHVKPESNE